MCVCLLLPEYTNMERRLTTSFPSHSNSKCHLSLPGILLRRLCLCYHILPFISTLTLTCSSSTLSFHARPSVHPFSAEMLSQSCKFTREDEKLGKRIEMHGQEDRRCLTICLNWQPCFHVPDAEAAVVSFVSGDRMPSTTRSPTTSSFFPPRPREVTLSSGTRSAIWNANPFTLSKT